jgi:NAD(P)-dependent dehydrogenase (short-subunit alcohol dehydrogenase family)
MTDTTTWQGQTAVITGAASGFGLETCRIAAKRGMRIVMADVQADALATARQEIEGLGAQVLAQRVDVSKANEVQALADATLQRFGAPNFVFNNAGVGGGGLVWESSLTDWQWVIGVNLMGVVHGVHAFTPMMLEAAKANKHWQGHIVNTASMAGLLNPPNMGVYNVTKHAVVSLSETLFHDLGLVTDQVHAHVLCPFFVPTGIHESHRNRPADLPHGKTTLSQRVAQELSQKAVTSGKITAAEVAHLVFEAMDAKRFYIYSHPKALATVRERMEDIVAARNPTDPFKDRPEVGERLRAALRQA